MYDRRGYARSDALEVSPVLETQVADLLSVCAGRRSVLIGHSLGGVIALATAAARPSLVAAVGCYEPPLRWLEWWPRPPARPEVEASEVAESFMKRLAGEELWRALPEPTRVQRRREGRALLADLAAADAEPFAAAELSSQVLVGVGTETDEPFKRGAKELVATLPDAHLHVIPGAGHGVHMSHPDLFAAYVRAVVAR